MSCLRVVYVWLMEYDTCQKTMLNEAPDLILPIRPLPSTADLFPNLCPHVHVFSFHLPERFLVTEETRKRSLKPAHHRPRKAERKERHADDHPE